MKNSNLAIAIPTYNRAEILKENYLIMLQEIQKYSIPIYISDDSTNDDTELIITALKNTYEHIYYFKNSPGLGHDENYRRTLRLPSEEYIWYLGDAVIIRNGGIGHILKIIAKYQPDYISVNSRNRNLDVPSQIYTDGNLLLKELCWHLTKTGATIYSRKMVNIITNFDLSLFANFPQIAFIFNGFTSASCKLYWENEKIIYGNKLTKSYWQNKTFKTFLEDWPKSVKNLDLTYTDKNKEIAIVSHSILTGIFNFKSLVNYRYKGIFGWREYSQYFEMFKKHSQVNTLIIALLVLTPRFIISSILYIYFYLSGKKN